MAASSLGNKTSKPLAPAAKNAAPAPIQARQEAPVAPPHEYLGRPQLFWPPRKIMPEESSKTYANIHPFALASRLLFSLMLFLIYLAIVIFFAVQLSQTIPLWLSLSAAVFLVLPWLLAEVIEILFMLSTFRFSLQQEYLFVRAGAINPIYHMIPYENVQDTQVMQGIVQKMLGISTVVVSTPASAVVINDIRFEDAQKFREDLLTLARMHKGMAE